MLTVIGTPDGRPVEVRLGVDVDDFVQAMRRFGEVAADPDRRGARGEVA